MSKQTQKLFATYAQRLDTVVCLFEKGISDFEKATKELKEEQKRFEELRFTMFLYHLISESDFEKSTGMAYDLKDKAYERLLNIKYPT